MEGSGASLRPRLPVAAHPILEVQSCSTPTGPRACMRPVAMPISAPKPNSPPSANWVEALCRTMAESTSSRTAPPRRCPRSRCSRCDASRRSDMVDRRVETSTTLTVMIASRYSVPSPLRSPASRANRPLARPRRRARAAGLDQRVDRFPKQACGRRRDDQQRLGRAATPVRRILAFTTIFSALSRSAADRRTHAQRLRDGRTPAPAPRVTRSTRLFPPRGTMTSSAPPRPSSISPTASRAAKGASVIAASGSPASFKPATRQAWIAADERKLSEPPRSTTALPLLRQSAPRQRSH